jgi:hypothetical protein
MKSVKNFSLALVFCLVSVSSNVFCGENWAKYEEDATADSYIDLASIRLMGNVTSYRAVVNFRQRATPTLSTVTQYEIKCAAREARFMKAVNFTEHFGAGRVVGTITPAMVGLDGSKFYPVEYGVALQYKLVCQQK